MSTPFHLLMAALFMLHFSGIPKPGKEPPRKHAKKEIVFSLAKKEKEDNDIIPWLYDRRLTWDDFLCEPRRNTDAVASTSTSLGIAYQINSRGFTYDISCNFSKAKSWGLVKTPYILTHEQGHFDITEIYARKLHQAFQQYVFNKNTYKRDLTDIYNAVVAEKEAFQEAYDSQTDHSRNKPVQAEW